MRLSPLYGASFKGLVILSVQNNIYHRHPITTIYENNILIRLWRRA